MLRRPRLAVLLALVLAATAGCGSSSGGSSPSTDSSGGVRRFQGTAGTERSLKLQHGDLAIRLPKGVGLQADDGTDTSSGGCTADRATIVGPHDAVLVGIELVAAACSTGKPQGRQGNGDYGQYVTIADVTKPIHPTTTDLPIGTLTIFGESRYLCTNSCRNLTSTIGLLRLAHPADPAFPTVMLIGDDDTDTASARTDVLDVARRLTTSGDAGTSTDSTPTSS